MSALKRLFDECSIAALTVTEFLTAKDAVNLSRCSLMCYATLGRSNSHVWKRYLLSDHHLCHPILRSNGTAYVSQTHPLNYRLLVVLFTSDAYARCSSKLRSAMNQGFLRSPLRPVSRTAIDKLDVPFVREVAALDKQGQHSTGAVSSHSHHCTPDSRTGPAVVGGSSRAAVSAHWTLKKKPRRPAVMTSQDPWGGLAAAAKLPIDTPKPKTCPPSLGCPVSQSAKRPRAKTRKRKRRASKRF